MESRNLTFPLILLCSTLLFSGCMSLNIKKSGTPVSPPVNNPHKVTKWIWFWGIGKDSKTVQLTEPCEAICWVSSKKDMGQTLISTLSLGMAVPITMEYYCCTVDHKPPMNITLNSNEKNKN